MKRTLAVLVVAVVVLLVAARWFVPRDEASLDATRADAVSRRGSPALEGSRLRDAEAPDDSAASAPTPASGPWAVVGRVVCPGRVPAVGVRVHLFAGRESTEPDDAGRSDADGRFRLHPRRPMEPAVYRVAADASADISPGCQRGR